MKNKKLLCKDCRKRITKKSKTGYCSYCECQDYRATNPKFKCFLFKTKLIKIKSNNSFGILRCKKCLKGEIR